MQSRDYVVLRAVEVGLAAAVVAALLVAFSSGWLTASAQKFSDWYASQVNGLLTVTVVSTTVTLPQVERTDLPIPQVEPPVFSASQDDAEPAASPGAD